MVKIRAKAFRGLIHDERGSLSVLIIGLFLLTMALVMVMSDISALVSARKALTQQTEFLVQQGAQSIDLDAYYQGRGGLLSYLAEKTIIDQSDPGIPLDCTEVIRGVANAAEQISDSKLKNFKLIRNECNGNMTYVETQAEAVLPYSLPFLSLDSPIIYGYASNSPERRNGLWIRGVRLW